MLGFVKTQHAVFIKIPPGDDHLRGANILQETQTNVAAAVISSAFSDYSWLNVRTYTKPDALELVKVYCCRITGVRRGEKTHFFWNV